MTEFEITPLRGVGPMDFGMTDSEIAKIMGDPLSVSTNNGGERVEYRDHLTIRYGDSGVVEFTFPPEAKVFFQGLDIFRDENIIEQLMKHDPSPVDCLGFLLFLNLGIAITGIHDGDESQRAVTACPSGRWDSFKKHFMPYELPPK